MDSPIFLKVQPLNLFLRKVASIIRVVIGLLHCFQFFKVFQKIVNKNGKLFKEEQSFWFKSIWMMPDDAKLHFMKLVYEGVMTRNTEQAYSLMY